MVMGRLVVRKAVAGMVAFIIGISIIMVTLIPLLVYLNTASGETLRAMGVVREFYNQRTRESLDVVREGGVFRIKNTGSVPITVILAVIDGGKGCGRETLLIRTSESLNPGDVVSSIAGHGLDRICYIVTSRGNVFPVKEKYAVLPQLPQPVTFTPNNTGFAEDLYNSYRNNITARYNERSSVCDKTGVPALFSFDSYDPAKKLLTINDTSGNIIIYELGGCFSLTFKNSVSISENPYAVAVFYRLVLVLRRPEANFEALLRICLQQGASSSCASSSNMIWYPTGVNPGYVVLEGVSLIPVRNALPGVYDLNVTLTLDKLGGNRLSIGVEYIAVLNAALVSG
ncbi:hypothetical protein ATG_02850 [Desulfurococcaceae archaeon AG1]|jgi:hypothetical protein|nr:MAG: hypothetical protein DJ555_03460 [Desulfurococcaceae archaeon]GAY25082.1 hypothetical protein ATG_02850 [Desulfurococcaceae archaeon AG1]